LSRINRALHSDDLIGVVQSMRQLEQGWDTYNISFHQLQNESKQQIL